jgi:hypothetical protein
MVVSSPKSDRINEILCIRSGMAALVCLVVVLTLDLTSFASHPNLLPLLVLGVPILVAGQLWVIAVMNARTYPEGQPNRRELFQTRPSNLRQLSSAPRWVAVVVGAAVLIGAASFLVGFAMSHGKSHATPDPASVLLGFYAIHWGVETSERYRRNRKGLAA